MGEAGSGAALPAFLPGKVRVRGEGVDVPVGGDERRCAFLDVLRSSFLRDAFADSITSRSFFCSQAGNCEVYIPHPKGKDACVLPSSLSLLLSQALTSPLRSYLSSSSSSPFRSPYPESPYGRVLSKPHPPYPTSSPLTVGQTPFLQPSHFDLEPLSESNPSNTDPNSPEGNDLSPQMSDVFRLVLKQVEDLEKQGGENAESATRMDRLRSAKRKDWEKEVPEEMRETLDKEREGREEATRKWVKGKVLGRREEAWAWAVARMGDEWLARSGREEIRRLSLKGGKEGEEGVGKIVRWVGTEEQGEDEED